MSFEEEIRKQIEDHQREVSRRNAERKALGKAWEIAKRDAIIPACGTVVDVARDYDFLRVGFECENGGCTLELESPRAKKPPVHLRFTLDLSKGRIGSSSDFNGEHYFALDPLDIDAIEARVSFFLDEFLKSLDGGD